MFLKEDYPIPGEIEISYGKHHVSPENTNKLHRHPCCELVVIRSGEVTLTALGTTVKVYGRSIIFYPEGLIHNPFTSGEVLYERYKLRFYPETVLGAECDEISDYIGSFSARSVADESFENIIAVAKILHRTVGEGSRDRGTPLATSLLRSLLLLCSKAESTEGLAPESYIQRVTDYIRKMCGERLTAADIAAHFFVSRGKLNYDIKAYCNMTVGEYVTLARVERAKELLQLGYSVSRTAKESGFSTPSYLIKVFSSYVGETPLKYQLRCGWRILAQAKTAEDK